MQWSLSLLVLMGHCSFFTCYTIEYKFINENKTWTEAQTYCRENFTNLATVFNRSDMERLWSTYNQTEAWIGLYNNPGKDNRTWHWSLPGVEYKENNERWDTGQPGDNNGNLENCALITRSVNKWSDYPCTYTYGFICYNAGKQLNETFTVIKYQLNWLEAQKYCRENHTDLISGVSQLDQFINTTTTNQNQLWIGLFRDTWRWSDGTSSSFRNWESVSHLVDDQNNKKCAATMLEKKGKWKLDDCDHKKPFFCYEDNLVLIKENKTWVEALNHCRENYYDLVSITNLDEQIWAQNKAKNASSSHVWLGLRYTCTLDFWFWVTDKMVSYENWASDVNTDDCDMSAALETGGRHQWVKKRDDEKFNFICSKN